MALIFFPFEEITGSWYLEKYGRASPLKTFFCDHGTFLKSSLWTWLIFLPEVDHLQFLALQYKVLKLIVSSQPHLSHIIVSVSAPILWVYLLIFTFMPFLEHWGCASKTKRSPQYAVYWTLKCYQLCKKITS